MSEAYNLNRLYWHSRRGMLELDLILMPFVQKHFPQLDEADKDRYVQLLASEDQDLFAWFLGHKKPDDPELKKIIDIILEKHGPLAQNAP